jgi:hypothetical protein
MLIDSIAILVATLFVGPAPYQCPSDSAVCVLAWDCEKLTGPAQACHAHACNEQTPGQGDMCCEQWAISTPGPVPSCPDGRCQDGQCLKAF